MAQNSVNGDKVSWKMVCDSPDGKPKLTGEITYHGDTVEGILRIDMQGIEMTQNMSGRRIGGMKVVKESQGWSGEYSASFVDLKSSGEKLFNLWLK